MAISEQRRRSGCWNFCQTAGFSCSKFYFLLGLSYTHGIGAENLTKSEKKYMSNDVFHQVGQILIEQNNSGLARAWDLICSSAVAIYLYLGTVNGSFVRVFDPSTWTLQDYASFASFAAAIMYFMAKRAEWKLAKLKAEIAKREMEQQQ